MPDRIADLEARLAAVEKRLSGLEVGQAPEAEFDKAAAEPTLDDGFVASASTHIGRVLLIFGGAYLLRAITDFQFVPTGIGIAMGATYAVYWLFMAWRRGQRKTERASAAFFGGTSVLLALPLLVEAVTRFELLSGRQGLVALTIYFSLALLVAMLRQLRSLAWLVTAGSVATAVAILIASHEALLVSVFLVFVGLASLAVVYRTRWMGLQWLGGLAAIAGVAALIGFSVSEQWSVEPRLAALVAGGMFLAYLFSFAYRSHIRADDIGLFEAIQALVAGVVMAVAVRNAAAAGQLGLSAVGLLSALLGVLAYALALTKQTRRTRKHNFFYYTTLGLLLVLAGTALLMPPIWAATVWCAIALALAWVSGRAGWVTLSLQCTFMLLAAGIGSGLLATGLHALAGEATPWPPAVPAHVGIALTTVACLFIPVAQKSERWGIAAGLPQLVVLVLSVWEVGGLFVAYTAPLVAAAGGSEPNAAILAAVRTSVLSVAAVTLALSSRHRRWPEARWLVYPLLIVVAIKLFLEDFPNGEPVTLFIALAFVGSALLLVARLLRRDKARV